MSAKVLKGKIIAKEIKQKLKKEVQNLKKAKISPHLVAVQVGENPASQVYIRQQQKACQDIGVGYQLKQLACDISQEKLITFIEDLNQNKKVTGIILQMPLPSHLNSRLIQTKIFPNKDVEGVHPQNMGRLVYGNSVVIPPTAQAAMELLKSTGVNLKGKEVTIVGHSEIVGKPIALLLLQSELESATPTICHIATRDLSFHTKKADVVIVAVGKPNLIQADMITEGAIVIDIGINRVPVLDEDGKPVINKKGKPKQKIVGDVDFEKAKQVCSYITPVPGGVGPLTVAMLLKNTIQCAKLQSRTTHNKEENK